MISAQQRLYSPGGLGMQTHLFWFKQRNRGILFLKTGWETKFLQSESSHGQKCIHFPIQAG